VQNGITWATAELRRHAAECPQCGSTGACNGGPCPLLRRLAAAASGSCGVAGETQHPETPAPADPRSIDYHQVSPARLNPAVCICGLGPDAAIHNEPPHQFNSRLKASHHAAVHGICTDCHHHESAACHTAAVSQPDEEA
jgi:hypothetical protein